MLRASTRRTPIYLLAAASVLVAGLIVPRQSHGQEEYYRMGCLTNWMLGGCACAELPSWPSRCKDKYYGCSYPSFPDNERALCESWCNGQYPDADDQFCLATPSDTIPGNTCWSCTGVNIPVEDPGGGSFPPEEENQDVPEGGGGSVGGGCYVTRVCTYFPNGQVECGPDNYYCD